MRGCAGLVPRGNENQMNRTPDRLALWNVNERAILKKSGIERGKGVVLRADVACQMFLRHAGITGQRDGKIGDGYTVFLNGTRRKFRREVSVHKHQPRRVQPGEGKLPDDFAA